MATIFGLIHDDVVRLVLSFIAAPAGRRCCSLSSMCPASEQPHKDPRVQPRAAVTEEQPQEIISGWKGVLLMAGKTEAKMKRIADVTCCPAPPVPLPERVQVEKEFHRLDPAQKQVCIGLPFFELHKQGYVYHRESEWSKFLHFLHDTQKFAIIKYEGWQLFVRPPDVSPPDGFSSIRVHYRCISRAGTILLTAPPIIPEDPIPPPLYQEAQNWTSQPATHAAGSSGGDMEVKSSQTTLKRPNIDFTAKLSCQPKVKRPRVGDSFPGFGSTSTNRANFLSSSEENLELQEFVSKAKDKPKSVAHSVNDVVYDISPSIGRVSNPPVAHGNGSSTWEKGKVSASVNGGAFEIEAHGNGLFGDGITSGTAPVIVDDRWEKYKKCDSGEVEKHSQAGESHRLHYVSNGMKKNNNLGAVPVKSLDWMKKYLADASRPKAIPSGGSDIGVVEKHLQASENPQGVSNGVKEKGLETRINCGATTSGAAPANQEWMKKHHDAEAMEPEATSTGGDSSATEEPSQNVSGSFNRVKDKIVLECSLGKLNGRNNGTRSRPTPKRDKSKLDPPYKCSPNDMVALKESSQAKEILKGSQETSLKHGMPMLGSLNLNEDLRIHKDSQVADETTNKGKEMDDKDEGVSNRGVHVSLKSKQVPKPASNGNKNIVGPHCRRKASFYLINENVAKPQVVQALPAIPEKYRVGTKSGVAATAQDAAKQKDVSSTISGSDPQQTNKFVNRVIRSKPQKIQFKKIPTEGASEGDENTSTSPKEEKLNRWEHWCRMIENILQLMYLAEDRNAAIVNLGVEEVYWSAEKKNVVAVTIGDDGVVMASKEKEFFASKEFKEIPADYLIILTKTEKDQLVALTHKHDLKCLSYFKYDGDGTTLDARWLSLQSAYGTIEKFSPFCNALSFIDEEFAKIDTKGTRMILYGYGDLVFKQKNVKEEDGIMRKSVQIINQNGMNQLSNGFDMDKRTFIETLRSYAEASYLRPEVMIQVQGTRVKRSLGERLSADGIQYIKRWGNKEISLSLSTNKIGSRPELSGICLYYQNRLLEGHEAFLKVGKMLEDSNYGLGVVGAVDITSLMDLHGAQRDFKGSESYNMFMYWLADKVHEYWDGLKDGRKEELDIHIPSQLYPDENISKTMSEGQMQEAMDVCENQINGLTSPLLESPEVAGCSNTKTFKRCNDCGEWREMPFGTEIDLLPLSWTCNMLPFNGPCRSEAEKVEDDELPLSKLLKDNHESKSESENLESKSGGSESDEDGDFEPDFGESKSQDEDSDQEDEDLDQKDEDSDQEDEDLDQKDEDSDQEDEYETEEIVDVKAEANEIKFFIKWVGYHHDENTWEPFSNLTNSKELVKVYFIQHPSKILEIKKKAKVSFQELVDAKVVAW